MKEAMILLMLITAACTMQTGVEMKEKSITESRTAIFAGGCFWCMESIFEPQEGVIEVVSGYTGGNTDNPTYEQVGTGLTGHYEAIEVEYDPQKITYEELLELYWRNIDPHDKGGQFADRGSQYKTAIFYKNEEQKRKAESSKQEKEKLLRKKIVTEILPAKTFYPAERYHQDYHKKSREAFEAYKKASGREERTREIWEEGLTAMQYAVTQEGKTEPAFANEYWDEKREGIYVDVVSGKPLFSSKDKYDSGTGWPSFTKTIEGAELQMGKEEQGGVEIHTEASHLGHIFEDGPAPAGKRYCINSAALRFIPKEDLEKEGYGEYRRLFE